MTQIIAFDFDGTLTNRDTLLAFIRYAKGGKALLGGLLRHLPLLVLMKLGLYDNGKTKQRVFAYFFKGMELATFDAHCQQFAHEYRDRLLRDKAIDTLRQASSQKATILIVSASVDNWVKPFFDSEAGVIVVGTQVEVVDGRLTGRFLTPNCYGQEKVNRILALFPHRQDYHLTAYGDSRGDKEMLAFADKCYYKPFRP